MKRLTITTLYFLILMIGLSVNTFAFNPEFLVGNRSVFYQHALNTPINSKIKFNNISQIDKEYFNNRNNIFFIRNTISYVLLKDFSVNAAVGLKNPGSFSTFFVNYNFSKSQFSINYSMGITLQKKFSYEQMFIIEKNFPIKNNLAIHSKFQALTNIAHSNYLRGFQHIRFGIKSTTYNYGFAINFDQFNNNSRTLSNYGLYIKKII